LLQIPIVYIVDQDILIRRSLNIEIKRELQCIQMMIFRVTSIKLCMSNQPKRHRQQPKIRASCHLLPNSSIQFTSQTLYMLWDHSFTTAAGLLLKILLTILRVINSLGFNNNNNKSRCSNSCKIRIIQTNTQEVNSKFMSRSNSLRWSISL